MDGILSLISHYGYLVILFGVMAESTGVPLPGETILLASGFLVQRGHLDLGDAIVFGILGAVVGDQIGYWVGREGGRRFVLRWGRYFAVLALRSWESRVAVVLGAALMVVLIGFSRMYLGVHYFSDVLAGYAAGGVWLSALITGAETIRRSKKEAKPTGRTS